MHSVRWRTTFLLVAASCVTAPTGDVPGDGDGADTKGRTLVLRGTVVTMDEARGAEQVLEDAAVVIQGEQIKAILERGAPLPTGPGTVVLPSASGASDWVIVPGLINAHNHLAYNTAQIVPDLPLYENTYQWRDEAYYDEHIQLPKRLLGVCSASVDELGIAADDGDDRVELAGMMGRYSEAKELASGTTTTQGSFFGVSIPAGYGQHLVRNLDSTNFGHKRVSQVALGVLVESFDPRTVVARMASGELDAWLVHLLEGTDAESAEEFDCLRAMGLVREELALVHGTALTDAQLAEMAEVGAKLIASPLDNLLYYGTTPDLRRAWELGINVSIGTDWTPAGTKNLLAELKVMDLLNQQHWGGFFEDRDLVQMVTSNPADAIGWRGRVGRLRAGLFADVAVYRRRPGSVYRSVIDATEADVRLVMVGGDPLFGDVAVMDRLKPADHEVVESSCGFEKAIDVTSEAPRVEHGDLGFAQVVDLLEQALAFDFEWIFDHHDEARANGWTREQLRAELDRKFRHAMEPRELNPMFTCEDDRMLEEIRLSANVRTAFGGLCLDLRPWYGGNGEPDCGTMPAHPPVLTVEEHPGDIPARPPSWCAEQDWTSDGPLPTPP
jgi:cytosine/adenosine deaminase-related metal-dependent hydrolase